MITLEKLRRIVEVEYHNIVTFAEIMQNKLRIYLIDNSFVDVGFSVKVPGRYSYHWERRHIDQTIYRHDNFPDPRWARVPTFPRHFHNGSQDQVQESNISENPEEGIREFMAFVKSRINR